MMHKRHSMREWLLTHPANSSIIVCENGRWIYMKIPKVAGTSILRGFLEQKVSGVIHKKDKPVEFRRWLHRITNRDLKTYFVFSFVRNPWSRAKSAASYFRDIRKGAYFQSPSFTFDSLVGNWQKVRSENPAFASHAIPQHVYTHAGERCVVDYIGRFENLQTDFASVCKVIGCHGTLPRLNESHHTCVYSDTARETIGRIYRRDIELFGYGDVA